jgi:ABC-type glycerol-3-phosphate transport system substrate-binding protein
MRSKKLVLALLLILPLFITACSLQDLPLIGKFFGDETVADSGDITLTFWGLWEDASVMEEVIAKYTESHPNVTINYDDRSVVDVDDYRKGIYNQASQEGAPFDIALVHNTWVPSLKGSLVPSPTLDAAFVNDNMYPVVADSAVDDGKVYAVPMYYDGLALVYNKAHLQEIDQLYPPTAWEEFRGVARDLTKRDVDFRAGTALGSADNIDFFSDILGVLFAQGGVNVPEDLHKEKAAIPFKFYAYFVSKERIWSSQMPEASAAFSRGAVSMIFVPSWTVLDIKIDNPDLDIGVAPVPQLGFTGQPTRYWGSFWMAAVPSGSAHAAAAWEFLQFLSTEEAQLAYHNSAAAQREFGPAFSLTTLKDEVSVDSLLRPYLRMAPDAVSNRFAARAGNSEYVEALRTAVNGFLTGGVGAQEALVQVQKTVAGL